MTYGGSEKLEERSAVRPASETLFCEHYANIIHSHGTCPKLPWCSGPALGKTCRLLRHPACGRKSHAVHATAEEAETSAMFNIYTNYRSTWPCPW